ncbi:MAG TPA: hypothetical protein VMZ92_16535 [Planctomycetota bacterium]|nr:hypothetical protein [Planctomycetota bacterium]
MGKAETITLRVQDVSEQREFVADVPTEATWGEAMASIVKSMQLPTNTPDGEETVYTGRLERQGRHLHPSEVVGDVLQNEDRIVMQPEITAG